MISKTRTVLFTGALLLLYCAISCSVVFALPGDAWDQTFVNGYASIRIVSSATLVADHYEYVYVLTLSRTGGNANMNLSTFSVGSSPIIYDYTDTYNSKGTTYFGNKSWASDQTSVRWDKPTGGTNTVFPASPSSNTVTFSFNSFHTPEAVPFAASGGYFTTIGSGASVWGMSANVVPEPASLATLGFLIAGAGGALVRRVNRRR